MRPDLILLLRSGRHLLVAMDAMNARFPGCRIGVVGTPGSAPAYVAMGHLWFDSMAAYDAAFGANADAILADIPNYTDIEPIVQISEVMID